MRKGKTGTRIPKPSLPGPLYCDSSALLKLYVPELGSDELNRLLKGRPDLIVSDLAVTEIVSALCRRHRDGTLGLDAVSRVHRIVLSHLKTGIYRRIDLVSETNRHAERLLVSLKHIPLRTLDALHLAMAISSGAVSLITYDRRLKEAAFATGLNVYPGTSDIHDRPSRPR